MSIRVKALIITSAIFCCLLALVSYYAYMILLHGFCTLERKEQQASALRVRNALNNERADLEKTLGDWAAWDETYTFIRDKSPEYITANLADDTLVNLRVSAMIFADTSGRVVHAKGVDPAREREAPIPSSVMRALANAPELYRHADNYDIHSSIICVPEAMLLVASYPIVRNDNAGPIRGTMLMMRALDAEMIHRLVEMVNQPVDVYRYHSTGLPADFRAVREQLHAGDQIITRDLSPTLAASYFRLDDLTGKPALILRVQSPREVYRHGLATVNAFIAFLLISGVVLGIATILLLEYVVLSRLAKLNVAVKRISAGDDLAARVPTRSTRHFRDELDTLTGNINEMLGAVETAHHALLEQRALRESESRYRELVEQSPTAVFLLRGQRCVFANAHAASLLGAAHPADLIGKSALRAVAKEDRHSAFRLLRAIAAMQSPERHVEIQLTRGDGTLVDVELVASPLRYQQQPAVQIIAHDISERRKAEQAVRVYQQRLRALSAELSLAEEKERRRIAADLHDHIGQGLVASRLMLGMLSESIDAPASLSRLEEVRALLEELIEWSRTLTRDLSPPILYERGIEDSMQWLSDHMHDRYGLQVTVTNDGDEDIPPEMRVMLFRATQELLMNVVKHAQAESATVNLSREGDTVRLTVEDTGAGFDPSAVEGGMGFGLFSLRERIRHWRGQMDITSQPGQGTRVSLRIPVSESESQENEQCQ